MTIENGAAEAANDTVVADNTAASQVGRAGEPEDIAPEGDEGSEGEDKPNEDEEELDVDGEKFRIPRKLREAIAKPFQQGFTTKTQELAEQRKALEGEREGFTKQTAAQKAHFQEAAKVIAYNDRLAELEGDQGLGRYKNVDWLTLSQTNPDQYQQHRAIYDSLKDQRDGLRNQRDTAARTWTEKEQEYTSNANREYGERVAKAQAEIAKQVEGWSPGNELDVKLTKYGIGLGFSERDLGETAIRNPQFVKQLNRLRIFDEAEAKAKTKQTFEKSQAAQPVTRVGGNGGSANTRKTTDASGDALSADEWVKRERERLSKRKA